MAEISLTPGYCFLLRLPESLGPGAAPSWPNGFTGGRDSTRFAVPCFSELVNLNLTVPFPSPATQNALDPRRLGQQNSGFSNEDIADIVCMLFPRTDHAEKEVRGLADVYNDHIVGRYAADAIKTDPRREDDPREFGRTRGLGNHTIVLRLSANTKSPNMGFTFGRNEARCDIPFYHDPLKRLSNIHFRIYINSHGVLMLEDTSTNGTIVDDVMLKKKRDGRDGQASQTRRTLESGTTVKILMHENRHDMEFIVRIPHREGALEVKYENNLRTYFRERLGKELDLDQTIGPGPSGPVSCVLNRESRCRC